MRRQRWMRPCAAVLALLMSVALPVEAWAATQTDTVSSAQETALTERLPNDALATTVTGAALTYIDDKGVTQTAPSATAVTANDTVWNEGWYVVQGDITIGSRVTVNGNVHLILADGGKLTVNGGIQVVQAQGQLNSLSIYGQAQGSGELKAVATQSENNAGIGGALYTHAGAITINGGKVTAVGGDASAGIGSGPVSFGGIIAINGGHVVASSAANGAGIGGGMQCVGAGITINGGTVEATGGNQAAGIGSGTGPTYNPAVVTINGGQVTATGGSQGAGIGDGMGDGQGTAKVASIAISGGTVTAKGGSQGAAIGGGAKTPGGTIAISGGTVTATGADGASGIGHGGLGATGGEITISGGTVTAIGGSGNPGISCKDAPTGQPIGQDGRILISGGTVYASPKAGEANGPAIRGALSTEANGNALIVANGAGITDKTHQANWSGLIFDGASDGKVYATPTLQTNATLPKDKGLTIPNGSALTINDGVTLTLDNTTVTVEEGATLTNNGTISGNGSLEGDGTLGGTGVVEQGITAPQPPKAVVTLTATDATYGSDVTFTAKVAPATNARTAEPERGKVSFYIQTESGDVLLGKAPVNDGVATFTINLSGEMWEKGFALGNNVVAAVYGGDMALAQGSTTMSLNVNPMSQQAPNAPELEKRDRSSITLKAVENNANGAVAEYSKDEGKTWQDSPEFKDLSAGTTYRFVVRYKAVGMYGVSENSLVAAFSTVGSGSGAAVTNPDGSTVTTQKDPVTGTVTETTKRPDGSVSIVETQKDGATTTTNKTPSGTTGTVVTDKDGHVTKVEGDLSGKDVAQAQKDEQPLKVPVRVPVASESDSAAHIDIDMPKDSGALKVDIPVEHPTSGTVALIVRPDGVEVPVKASIVTENSIIVPCDGSTVIKIVDRSKHFVDVHDVNHWAKDNVDFATARDLFSGTSDTLFSPDLAMTRGMLVTVLYRMEDSPALPGENLGYPFSDVTPDDWYSTAVYWAQYHGIVSGYNDGRFGPNDTITREQMAAILYNYARYKGYDTTKSADLSAYSDAAQVGEWAVEALSWANAEGLVNGTDATTLTPKGQATRAQVAAILMRFYQHVVA